MEKPYQFFWPIVFLAIFFIVSFFLALAETSLIAISKIKLRHMVSKGVKGAKTAQKILSHLDRLITSILVGNNIVNIGISAIGTGILIYFFGQKWGVISSTIVISFFILVFAEITPKLLAARNPERISLFVAGPVSFLMILLRPIISVFMAISAVLVRILSGRPAPRAPLITEEELRLMIEVGKEEGAVSDEERRMLHRIFEFGDTAVGDVMVPKDKMASIKIDAAPEQLLDVLTEEGHSRIPVYKDSLDDIKGIIYSRDLLHIWHSKGLIIIPDLVQPAYFVKTDKKVNEVLKDFQRMKIQIAIVTDENNKTLGMVTLEDLIEEIVGEIDEQI
jgi:Mg2+/Co2+ transporter CorB